MAPSKRNSMRKEPPSPEGEGAAKPKYVRGKCLVEGCTTQARTMGGVCIRHGAKQVRRTCKVDGCGNIAKSGGVCIRHGAKQNRQTCVAEGCTNYAKKGGVCVSHGAKTKKCKVEGCTNYAQNGGVCVRHGATKPTCKVGGCVKKVHTAGLCGKPKRKQHRPTCSAEGCTSIAKRDGVCQRHGAKPKTCKHPGCTNQVRRDGVCERHGAKRKRCSAEGCTSNARDGGGVCVRHGARRQVKKCKVEGCTNDMINVPRDTDIIETADHLIDQYHYDGHNYSYLDAGIGRRGDEDGNESPSIDNATPVTNESESQDEMECMAVEKEQVDANLVFMDSDLERTTRLHEQSSATQTVERDNDLAASDEIIQALSKEKANVEEELSKVSKQLVESRAASDGKVEQLQSDVDRLQERVNTLEASLKKAENAVETLYSEKARANEQVEALKSDRDAMQLELYGKIAKLQKDLDAAKEDNQSLTEKQNDALEDLEEKKTQLESLAQEKDKVEKQLSFAQEAGKSFKLKEKALKADIAKGGETIESLLIEKAQTVKALENSAAECASLSEEIKGLKAKRDEEICKLRNEKRDIEGQLNESEQSMTCLRREHGEELNALKRTVAKLASDKQRQEEKLQAQAARLEAFSEKRAHSVSAPPNSTESQPSQKRRKTNQSSRTTEDQANELAAASSNEGPDQLRGLDKALIARIVDTVIDSGEKVTFGDIAGLENVKRAVEEVVIWPMQRPELFTGLRQAPTGMLLFGPPGTGKTMIAKAIAHESGATFFSVSSSALLSQWLGESENLVKTLFAVARSHAPSVVFYDEVDSLLTQRKSDEDESTRRMKTEFLVQLDGVMNVQEGRVLFVGATNKPKELDEAARRRFHKRFYIPLPDQLTRCALIRNLLRTERHSLSNDEIAAIANQTDGFSGADLEGLCKDAAMGPVREVGFGVAMKMEKEDLPKISYKHFEESLSTTPPSVAESELAAFQEWNDKFGTKKRRRGARKEV